MAARFTSSAYVIRPFAVERGIPIFSEVDGYVENYQQIASDHLQVLKKGEADNPFIETELWQTLEDSTRAILLEHVPGNSRVLDVGVGLGRLLGKLVQYERFGVDISLDYLERAQATGIEVAFARIEDLPYADEYFDAILVCDVLEHVLDLNLCCKQILRVLKPGGLLIVRVPYREDLSGYLSEANVYKYVHLRNFDEYSIRLFFEQIMECEVLSVQEVAPYLVGAPRLKLRQLPPSSPVYALLREEIPPFPTLLHADVHARSEGQVKLGQELRNPETFEDRGPSAPVNPAPLQTAHPLDLLQRAMAVNEVEFINWIYDLKDNHPEWYRRIAPHVVYGIEMNVLVRKPLGDEI